MLFTGVNFNTNHHVCVSNHGIFKGGILLPLVITIEFIALGFVFSSIGKSSADIILGVGTI
jgi:hypothetical protein